jgi:hypothetical protein
MKEMTTVTAPDRIELARRALVEAGWKRDTVVTEVIIPETCTGFVTAVVDGWFSATIHEPYAAEILAAPSGPTISPLEAARIAAARAVVALFVTNNDVDIVGVVVPEPYYGAVSVKFADGRALEVVGQHARTIVEATAPKPAPAIVRLSANHPDNLDNLVERVSERIGVYPAAWDAVDPRDIAAAFAKELRPAGKGLTLPNLHDVQYPDQQWLYTKEDLQNAYNQGLNER